MLAKNTKFTMETLIVLGKFCKMKDSLDFTKEVLPKL